MYKAFLFNSGAGKGRSSRQKGGEIRALGKKLRAGRDLGVAGDSTVGTSILTQLHRTLKSVRKLVAMKEKDLCYLTLKYIEKAI